MAENAEKLLEPHPAALLVPEMGEDDYARLKESISGLGVIEPIVLFQGKILDGRHRYRACIELDIEPRFVQFEGGTTENDFVLARNLDRRQLTKSQKAAVVAANMAYHKDRAERRRKEKLKQYAGKGGKVVEFPGAEGNGSIPDQVAGDLPLPQKCGNGENHKEKSDKKGTAAAAAAESAGVSERTVEQAIYVEQHGTAEDLQEVLEGKVSVRAKEKEVRKRNKTQPKAQPKQKPKDWLTVQEFSAMSAAEQDELMRRASKSKSLNKQKNSKIEWSSWTWNPITGCLHNCPYCYARDIANKTYGQKFQPVILPERLDAPLNIRPKRDAAGPDLNIFTGSMADMFGKWVPEKWILAVLDRIARAPWWNFLMLTKFPSRLADFDFPDNAWVGTTVDKQFKVRGAEDAMERVRARTKFLSIEPMLGNLYFERLDLFDWIIIGGASSSTQTPEWVPPFDWLCSIHHQAREADCAIYHKTNLKLPDELRLVELPWLERPERELPEVFR